MLNRNKKVIPLEEGFKELGLDPEKMIGSMERNTVLVEQRSPGTPGSAGPPISSYGDPAHVTDQALVDGSDAGDQVDEGVRRVRVKRGTAAKRARKKAKIARRGKKGVLARTAKLYRRGAAGKRAIAKHQRLVKGKKRKKGERFVTADVDGPQDLASLREDVNAGGGLLEADMTSYEEAALNAAYLCALLCEVFDVIGEAETTETVFEVSESGASLSEDLEGIDSKEDMTEEQTQAFEELITTTVKALRFWEGLGAPTLYEAIELRMASEALSE